MMKKQAYLSGWYIRLSTMLCSVVMIIIEHLLVL